MVTFVSFFLWLRQWIVWVEGLHLPNRIELDSKVEKIRLAG